jgi:hypothetical protein
MRAVTMKIRKTARVRIVGAAGKCYVKFPSQNVGNIALTIQIPRTDFSSGRPKTVYSDGKIVRQWELVLSGDDLKVKRVV